jgi:hypothetical protein
MPAVPGDDPPFELSRRRRQGIGLGGADEVVDGDALGRVGREADGAAVEGDAQLRMMVFDVADPGERVDEGDGPSQPLKAKVFDRAVRGVPAAGLCKVAAASSSLIAAARWLHFCSRKLVMTRLWEAPPAVRRPADASSRSGRTPGRA